MQSIWYAGEILLTLVHNTSSRPGLIPSDRPEFLERGELSKQKFPGGGPQKNVSAYFHQITTPPRSPHLDHDQDRAAAFSIYLVNDDLDHTWMWHVRTNKRVRTNICKTSVFVVFVRNINICGRILTQFTGLLPTNTVAAKRDLFKLAERTCLGKSVSVSLRKNGPKGHFRRSSYFDTEMSEKRPTNLLR